MKQSQELVTPIPRYSTQFSFIDHPFYFSESRTLVAVARPENKLKESNKNAFRGAASGMKKVAKSRERFAEENPPLTKKDRYETLGGGGVAWWLRR
jgi:hypothetical protein